MDHTTITSRKSGEGSDSKWPNSSGLGAAQFVLRIGGLAYLITIMRTLLRHSASGRYFQGLEKWTLDRDEAYDFRVIDRALKFAQRTGIHDLELILSFDSPEQVSPISMDRFRLGLSAPRKREAGGRRFGRNCRGAVNVWDRRKKTVQSSRCAEVVRARSD